MRKLHPSQYQDWLHSLNDRELMSLYQTHCGQSEEPCGAISDLAQAIWFEAFDRGLTP